MANQAKPPAPSGAVIPAKDAVVAAGKHFTEVTGITSGVRVEEIELTEDGCFWLVTLGYMDTQDPFGAMFGRQALSYKIFKINAKTGAVVSMKIRKD